MNDRLLAWVRIGFGVLTIAAIVTQILNLIDAGVFNPTRANDQAARSAMITTAR